MVSACICFRYFFLFIFTIHLFLFHYFDPKRCDQNSDHRTVDRIPYTDYTECTGKEKAILYPYTRTIYNVFSFKYEIKHSAALWAINLSHNEYMHCIWRLHENVLLYLLHYTTPRIFVYIENVFEKTYNKIQMRFYAWCWNCVWGIMEHTNTHSTRTEARTSTEKLF